MGRHRASIRRTWLALGTVAGLSGCAANKAIEQIGPDTYALDCSGGAPTWAPCHSLARTACGGAGFDIRSQVSNEGSSGVGTNDWSQAGSQITRTMVVKCKSPAPRSQRHDPPL